MGTDQLGARVSNLEVAFRDMGQAIRGIDQSLQTLAALEVRHAETRDGLTRAFAAIEESRRDAKADREKTDGRLVKIEEQMPTLKLSRDWMLKIATGVVAIVGAAVIGLVVVGK
jgi:hypothetical protein